MQTVIASVGDPRRLEELRAYGILDTPPEQGFDDIALLATQACLTPVALVSLVAGDRQWFKARVGFPRCETDLESSVCAHALAGSDLLVIPDLTRDPRTQANPLVTSEPFIRFYAGAPLVAPSGAVLGSLCVIDHQPRPDGLTEAQTGALRALARQVVGQLELRRALAAQRRVLEQREALTATQAAVAAAGDDLGAVLDALVAGALLALPQAEGGVVELREGEELVYRSPAGTIRHMDGLRLPVLGSLAGCCVLTGEPIVCPDALAEPRVRGDLAERLRLRSCILVPVRARGADIGVLKLQSSRVAAFSEADIEVLRPLAGIVASGLLQVDEASARREIRASEGRYKALFESAVDDAIIVMDLDGTITDWNPGAGRIFGWEAGSMRGAPADGIFTPEDRADGVPAREMRTALERGRASDERWHLRRNGERFWATGEMTVLREPGGVATGFVKMLRDRTGEHVADRALAEAEARLRQAQEAGGIGLFSLDLADDILTPTPEFCRLHGLPELARYPASAFEGLVLAEDAHRVSTAAIRLQGELPRDVEYRIRRPDTGELRWIARRGELERDPAGRPMRFSGVARDTTEQRRALDALARSDERFRTMLETIEAAFAIVEVKFDADDRPVDYRFVEANPAFEREAGVNLRGKWVTEFAPDLERFWFETYGRVARTREPENFESYAEAFKRWFDVRAVPVGESADRQIAIIFNDVTARREAEERLRASEALARENVERVQLALAAGAIIGTWHWDLPTDRFTVDEAFARSFGLDPALGRDGIPLAQIVATVHPDDRDGLAAAIDAAIARGGVYAHQYRTLRADGRYYWLEANGRVDHAPDGTPLSFPGVLIDVEERRAIAAERDRAIAQLRALNDTLEQRVAERTSELMQAEEALRQAQKMEAVGQLTGGLAHDFNNLLAGISGSLELMQTRIGQGRLGDLDRYMAVAQGAAKRAAALTHRLLAFSRRQTLDPKPTDANRLVADMEELIRRTIGPQIALEVVGASGLWPTLIDPGQLENALLNLCINARDAMPDGGRITIETANRRLDRSAAARHEIPEGQYLSLSVTDTGTGMAPDVVARVFEPFFTTKPLGQGTGLGLSMIYGFARQSGGQVRIHSTVGQGTTVSLYLPRYDGEAAEAEAVGALAAVSRAAPGETVLIVDDEPSVRMLVTAILEDLGYTAIEAADSAAGLKVLQSDVRIDLLVTDVGLPGGMNGRQMADAGRERRPGLKVLFITGYAENAAVGNGHLDPGMQVLTKPFAMEALAGRIKELISGA